MNLKAATSHRLSDRSEPGGQIWSPDTHQREALKARRPAQTHESLHRRAPLFDASHDFVRRKQAPFYSPGHKGGRTLGRWFRTHIAELDLNNLPDTDTLHCPNGPILEAERLIADAWGVGQSFMLVQGSTCGNIAMAISALQPGEPVLVQRNAHKSVIAGLIAAGAEPRWLDPLWDSQFGVAHGLSAAAVEQAFLTTGAKALWVVNPTYYGTTADIAALAATCRRFGAQLLVDAAHGAHFAFHPDLPAPAEKAGAAATVQSIHKTLSGLSPAAVLHTDPAFLEPGSVRRALQLIHTTSPNFAVMSSIDLARRQMVLRGRQMLDRTLDATRCTAARLAAVPGLEILGSEHLHGAGTGLHQFDGTKLLIGTRELGVDGHEIVERLNRVHGVQPELAGVDHVLCIATIGNSNKDLKRLISGFVDVAADASRRRLREGELVADLLSVRPESVLTPREAFFAEAQTVPLDCAVGRISAEVITPYPPGIPLAMPGERLTKTIISLLQVLHRTCSPVSVSNPDLNTLKVVR